MNYNKPFYSFLSLLLFGKWKGIGLLCLFLFLTSQDIKAYDYFKEIPLDPIDTYDEVPVEIIVKGYLKFEADVIITDTRAVYVNVEELFKKLGIYYEVENNGNTLKGFIENESIRYIIDFDSKQINRGDRVIKSENGIVKELGGIYIETSVLSEAFGLNMIFNFRSLSLKLDADFELPLVKQARYQQMRENVSKLQSKSEIVIDTTVGRDYHLFNGGAVDWLVSSSQVEGGKTNNRVYLGLGAEVLNGELDVAYNYYDQIGFDNRQLYYNWRWIDNDNNYIKQVQVGKISPQTISFLSAPLVGASFNNSPNTVRKASGYYTIQEYTEPNWTVELYINDNLVDYTEADASGLYIFKVPNVYGYTTLTLKFYGPLGEERVEERSTNVPFTFMPANVLEYNVSGGVVEDGDGSTFGRGEASYGINNFITVGGGFEYLSSIPEHKQIPFANLSIQPFSKMVMNMEYAHNVSFKGLLNYYFGRSASLELFYSNYTKGQRATLDIMNEERKIRLSLPYRWNKISGNGNLSFNQYVYDAFNYNQVDAFISGRYKNYSANVSLASNWISNGDSFTTTTLVLSRRLRNGLIIRPTVQYNITDGSMLRYRAEIEKRVAKMSFTASYERNVKYSTDNVFLSFSYDLSFARAGFNASYTNKKLRFYESLQGSLAFGAGNGVVKSGSNSTLGKGGILFYPFLDLNQNGERDKGERLVYIENVKVNGGQAVTSKKDSIVRVSDLNAFINYDVIFSDNDLDNISWKFKHKTYRVLVDPNQYKKVDIPILVMGEVSGMVYLENNNSSKGLARITVQVIDKNGNQVAETLTERDGYFSYLGLKPGDYTIKVDEDQLEKLGYQVSPSTFNINVKTLVEADLIEGVDFTITPLGIEPRKVSNVKDSIQLNEAEIDPLKVGVAEEALEKTVSPKNNSIPNLSALLKSNEPVYSIQIGMYKEEPTLKQLYNLNPIYYENLPEGDTRYVYGIYSLQSDAVNAKNGLYLNGVIQAKVVKYAGKDLINLFDFIPSENKENKLSENEIVERNAVDDNMDPAFGKISEIEGSFFSVQIGVYKNVVTVEQLLNLNPIFYEKLPNKNTRYISEKYSTRNEAKIARNKIYKLGVKDAYAVAYLNGGKVDIRTLDALKRKQANNKKNIYGLVLVGGGDIAKSINNIDVQLENVNNLNVINSITSKKEGFSFLNVSPGKYRITLNEEQLKRLNYRAIPTSYEFERTDDVNEIEEFNFILKKLEDK